MWSPIGLQLEETKRPSILLVTKLLKSTIVWVLENEVRFERKASRVALKLECDDCKLVSWSMSPWNKFILLSL